MLQVVESLVKGNLPRGIKDREVSILPEGRVPHSMGERWLTIHPVRYNGLTPNKQIRKKSLEFGISLTQRVRKDPNDRFGNVAYLDDDSMTNILEHYIPVLESNAALSALTTVMNEIKIPPENTNPPYDPELPPADLPPKYSITETFAFLDLNVDPRHLYPSDFGTRSGNDKEQLYDKIAGYRMTLLMSSPIFQLNWNPIECKPPYDIS